MSRHALGKYWLGLLACASTSVAQATNPPVLDGGVFQVNALTVNLAFELGVGVGDDGSFVAVWESAPTLTDPATLYLRQFNSAGMPLGDETAIQSDLTGAPLAIAFNGSKAFAFIWSTGNGAVMAQEYSANGSPLNAGYCVDPACAPHPGADSAAAALDAKGNLVVAWTAGATTAAPSAIEVRQFNQAGTPVEAQPILVSSLNAVNGTLDGLSVALSPANGNFTVAWSTLTGLWSSKALSAIRAKRYSSGGAQIGAQKTIDSCVGTFVAYGVSSGCWAKSMAATSDANGNFTYVWQDYTASTGNTTINARRYNTQGYAESAKFAVATISGGVAGVNAAEDGAGDFVAEWVANPAAEPGAAVIEASAIAADNSLLGGLYQLTTDPETNHYNGQYSLPLSANTGGVFLAAWYQLTGPETGNLFGQLATIQ